VFSEQPPSLAQGAILRDVPFPIVDSLGLGVLLTPECDLAQDKAETGLLVLLADAQELFVEMARSSTALLDADGNFVSNPSKNAEGTLKGRIRDVQLNRTPRYHWLDALPTAGGPFVADFQFLTCLAIEEVQRLEVVGNLADPFRSSIATRYAAYAGRVGIPDPDLGVLEAWRDSTFESTFAPRTASSTDRGTEPPAQ
jgi:hypothetical protein